MAVFGVREAREVASSREFRAVWAAETISVVGDQLARVALAVLVYGRTSSAALAALTYALTFVPAAAGGLLLCGLTDRFPRDRVLVVIDLVRAGLAAGMAVPGVPLTILWILVGLSSAAAAPFKAAQLALLPQLVGRDALVRAAALRQMTAQLAQVVGFVGGGLLLTVFTAPVVLLVNAVTFAASAAIIAALVARHRPDPAPQQAATPVPVSSPGLWGVLGMVGVVGLCVVPEGLAAPYGAALGVGALGIGLLMAADPLGSAVGAWLAGRADTVTTPTLVAALAAAAALPLMACATQPGLAASIALWATSGALSTACLVHVQALVVDLVPDHRRGRAMGRVATCLYTSQGIAILGAGFGADIAGPFATIAVTGLLGATIAIGVGWWLHANLRERGTRSLPAQMSLLDMPETSSQATSPAEMAHPTPAEGAGSTTPSGDASATSIDLPTPRQPTPPPPNGAVTSPRTWALLAQPRPGVAFLLTTETVVLGLTAWAATTHSTTAVDFVYFAALLLAGALAAEATRKVERLRRRYADAFHINLSSIWTLAAALLLPPQLAAATAVLLYTHLWWRSWRRLPGMHTYRAVFSASNATLCCLATATLMHQTPRLNNPADLGHLLLAVAVYSALNAVLAATALRLLTTGRGRHLFGTWRENIVEHATLGLGALMANLLSVQPLALVLLVLPIAVLHHSVLIRQLEHAAITDTTTKLLTAAHWRHLTTNELRHAQHHNHTLAILMIDLDGLHTINTTHGHHTGDAVLRAVADTIRNTIGPEGIYGRHTSDELVATLPKTSHDNTIAVGQHLCDNVRNLTITDPDTGQPIDLTLTISVGIAHYPNHGNTLDDILLAADNAMFAAKDAGQGQVRAIAPTRTPPSATN